MSKQETDIANRIMIDLSACGTFLFKNVRGLFLSLDGKRKVRAGLQAPGASDLVGGTPITITQDMVGRKICVLTVIEVKTATGAAFKEQKDFINFVLKNGGFAGVARDSDEARKIVENKA
jgi:hypothetical protein